MDKRVLKFFIDLEKSKANSGKHILFNENNYERVETLPSTMCKYTVDGTPFYVKKWQDFNSVNSIVTSSMYNEIGLVTPPVYAVKKDAEQNSYLTASQDVQSIENLECVRAFDIPYFKNLRTNGFNSFKWEVLYSDELKSKFLKFMTQGCLEQLVGLFLVDEMRTDYDRHTKNYFLYKRKNSPKFEGVISIDLDRSAVVSAINDMDISFPRFLSTEEASFLPTPGVDYKSYRSRANDIRDALDNGVITPNLQFLMRSALEYNYPEEISNTCKKYDRKNTNKAYEPISRLWEYNRNTIGRDLGM